MANENKFEDTVSASEEVHVKLNLNDSQKSLLKSEYLPKPNASLHNSENKENNNSKFKISTCSNYEEPSLLCPLAANNSTSNTQDKYEVYKKSAVIQQLGSIANFSQSVPKQDDPSIDDSCSDLKAELHLKPEANDWSLASSKLAVITVTSSDSEEELEIVLHKKQKTIEKQSYFTLDNSNSDEKLKEGLHLASKLNIRTLASSKPDVVNLCSNSDDEDEILPLDSKLFNNPNSDSELKAGLHLTSKLKKQTLTSSKLDVINLCSDSDDENEILRDNFKSFNTKTPSKNMSQLPKTLITRSAIESNGTNSEIVFDKSKSYNVSSNSNPSLDFEQKVFRENQVQRKGSESSDCLSSKTLKHISVFNSQSDLDIPCSSSSQGYKNPLHQSKSSDDMVTNKYLLSAVCKKKRTRKHSTSSRKKVKLNSSSNLACSNLNAYEESVTIALPSTDERQGAKSPKACPANNRSDYDVLAALNNVDLVLNTEPFECKICFSIIPSGNGVILHNCLHSFCKLCLAEVIQHSETVLVRCPFNDEYACESNLQEREVKSLVSPEVFEKYLQKSITLAESQAQDSFHCKTINCPGWCLFENNVNFFLCPVCKRNNCLACAAIHEGKDCKQYQDYAAFNCDNDEEAKRTKKYLDDMLKTKQAKPCPHCHVVIIKHGGCDHMTCRMCKKHFSWTSGKPDYELVNAGVWPALILNRRLAVHPDVNPLGTPNQPTSLSVAFEAVTRRLSSIGNNQPFSIENVGQGVRSIVSSLGRHFTHEPATSNTGTGLSALPRQLPQQLQAQPIAEPIASTSRAPDTPLRSRRNALSTVREFPLGIPERRLLPLNPGYEESTELQEALRQYPDSVVMNIKCLVCYKNSFVFSHAQITVYCPGCSTVLCEPTGGLAILSRDMSRIS